MLAPRPPQKFKQAVVDVCRSADEGKHEDETTSASRRSRPNSPNFEVSFVGAGGQRGLLAGQARIWLGGRRSRVEKRPLPSDSRVCVYGQHGSGSTPGV